MTFALAAFAVCGSVFLADRIFTKIATRREDRYVRGMAA